MLLRWEAMQQVGELDERFFLYGEETDWQRRAARWAGRAAARAPTWSQDTTEPARAATRAAARCSSTPPRRPTSGSGTARRGWCAYRAAACAGATARAVMLSGERRAEAARRARLYVRGPRRCAGLARGERAQRRPRRHDGELRRRRAVRLRCRARDGRPGLGRRGRRWTSRADARRSSATQSAGCLAPLRSRRCARCSRIGRRDICHAHMTARRGRCSGRATAATAAPVVARDTSPARRGASRGGRLLAPWIARGLARQIAVSDFVASRVERRPDAVIPNGVPPSPCLWRASNRTCSYCSGSSPRRTRSRRSARGKRRGSSRRAGRCASSATARSEPHSKRG